MAEIDQDRLRTAVIGCGSTGTRRAAETSLHSRSRLLLCIDTAHAPARNTAERYGAAWSTDWNIAVDDERIDVVVVCTPSAVAYDVAVAALERGKHVLMETPMGGNLAQAEALAVIAERSLGQFKVGFNHRYHPGISRAHELFELGEIGEIVSMQVGYGNEEPNRSGGIVAADLVAWFAGLPTQAAHVQNADGVSGSLRYQSGVIADVHAPDTQRRNLFSLEVVGREGSLTVEGPCGGFGPERLTVARLDAAGSAPPIREEAFDGPDRSWAIEWHQFVDAIERALPYWGTARDGLAAMRIVEALSSAAP